MPDAAPKLAARGGGSEGYVSPGRCCFLGFTRQHLVGKFTSPAERAQRFGLATLAISAVMFGTFASEPISCRPTPSSDAL
jgi:hypothetical protein